MWKCPSEARGARIRTWARMDVVAEGGISEVTEGAMEGRARGRACLTG